MKADEPCPPIVKFGMSTDESRRMVERHFDLMDERDQIAAGVDDHNLRTACIAKALLDGRSVTPAPMAMPATEPQPAPVEAPPVVVITQRARPDNLRERFGLS
ncbi:hypothetical protein D0Z70_00260 [Sphingobium terrigena]|uniref:Uncharacterized protein n=2 Tax=Sphingobium terrigena TaxID=2304063 RepID=A0A418YXU2_9SPHN|nr:hypothetical protein D0Z70_00260 [Sphingobium terrigena]